MRWGSARARKREQLERWYQAGADSPLLTLPPGAPADLLRETIEAMSPAA